MACWSGASLAAVAFATALLHGLRVGLCDLWGATALFALTAGFGALMGGAWGALVGEACRGRKHRVLGCVLLGVAAPLAGIAGSLARFYWSPMIFAVRPVLWLLQRNALRHCGRPPSRALDLPRRLPRHARWNGLGGVCAEADSRPSARASRASLESCRRRSADPRRRRARGERRGGRGGPGARALADCRIDRSRSWREGLGAAVRRGLPRFAPPA